MYSQGDLLTDGYDEWTFYSAGGPSRSIPKARFSTFKGAMCMVTKKNLGCFVRWNRISEFLVLPLEAVLQGSSRQRIEALG